LATLLPLFLVAMGQTLVLIAGGIDLSVTSIMAVASVAGAAVMNSERGLLAGSPLAAPAGLLAMLFIGGGVGWLNGLAITRFRMPPFMVTLTAMMFFSGFAIWLTQSQNINNLPAAFNAVGGRTWITLLLTASVAVTVQALLSRSLWG
jgi:ribose transport system permease protein